MRLNLVYTLSALASLTVGAAVPSEILGGNEDGNTTLTARGDYGCGGVLAVSQCSPAPGSTGGSCVTRYKPYIRWNGQIRYADGDPDYRTPSEAEPCNRHYGPDDYWMRCSKTVDQASAGEAFGDYGWKTCYKRNKGDAGQCPGGGTSGTLSFLFNRYFTCS